MDFDEHRIRLTRPDGKSVSAYYDEESPDRLSPKARCLRTDLRKRLTAA